MKYSAYILALGVFLLSSSAYAQETKPAVEYRSLLNIPFETDGCFRINELQIVFPSPTSDHATLTISKDSGEEVASVPLHLQSYLKFPIFGTFVADSSEPVRIGKSGDFVLTIKAGEEVITRLPFSIIAETGDDAYAPPKGFLRDGPWRDFAYLSLPAYGDNGDLRFNWWMSLRELPADITKPAVRIRLMQGYKEVARSTDVHVLTELDWQFFASELVKTKGRNKGPLTMGELGARDASYLLIVEANNIPIKSYRLEVRNGHLQRADQSRIGFEPHADFISPRFIETSDSGSSSQAPVIDAYWLRRSGIRRSFAPLTNRQQNQQISKKD